MGLFKIKTLGCKVNQYESQVIREALLSAGYQEAEDGREAQLCIVNTCTVTAKADKESRGAIRHFIRENPYAEIVAAGCYVEADSAAIKAIDEKIRVVGNEDKLGIADFFTNDKRTVRSQRFYLPLHPDPLPREERKYGPFTLTLSPKGERVMCGITYFKGHTKAYVKIQDGCNNFCSYCKVPYVRGGSKSRSPAEILEEAKGLIRNGYRELVLTGVCLGDFGKDLGGDMGLAWLIRKIRDIEGDFRIRLSSIELPDVSDLLIDEMPASAKLCRHLHIPLQSGDDNILKKMNRRYTASEFIDRIAYIRSKIPDIGITTDVIVGFPNESELNFKNTLEVVRKVRPSRTHIFTYSPRKDTKAFDMEGTVPSGVKDRRFKQLKGLTDKFALGFRLKFYDRKQSVLIENTRDKETGLLTGYTDTYIKVLIDGPDELMGRLICTPINPVFLQVEK